MRFVSNRKTSLPIAAALVARRVQAVRRSHLYLRPRPGHPSRSRRLTHTQLSGRRLDGKKGLRNGPSPSFLWPYNSIPKTRIALKNRAWCWDALNQPAKAIADYELASRSILRTDTRFRHLAETFASDYMERIDPKKFVDFAKRLCESKNWDEAQATQLAHASHPPSHLQLSN